MNSQNAGDALKPEAVLQVGHRRAIRSVVFSADGKWVASGAKDNTIKVWDVASGRLLRTLYGHGSAVNSLSISPDGKLLASGSGKTFDPRLNKLFFAGGQVGGTTEDTSVRIWDVATGRQLYLLKGHELAVMGVAFSADGRTLTSASSDVIKVWETGSGKELRSLNVFPKPKGASFGSNFRPSLVPRAKNHTFDKWQNTFKDLSGQLLVSGSGEMVAAALPNAKFHLFDTVHLKKLQEVNVEAVPEAPGAMALSRDGQLMAFVRGEKEIVVQSAAHEKDLWHTGIAGQGRSTFLSFGADGRELLAETLSGNQRILQRWASYTGKPSGQAAIPDNRTSRVMAFSPNGRLLAMVARGSHAIELRDVATGQLIRALGRSDSGAGDTPPVNPEVRKQLIADGLTQEGELSEAGEDVSDFSKYRAGEAITFAIDGRWLLTKRGAASDLTTAVWDTATGTAVEGMRSPLWKELGNPDESPDGRFRVVPEYATENKSAFMSALEMSRFTDPTAQGIKLVETKSGRKLRTLGVGRIKDIGGIPAAGFSLDSSRIAVTGYLKYAPEIYVFETVSGKKIAEFASPEDEARGPVTALAISRDGSACALGFRDQGVEVVDATSGKSLVKTAHPGGTAALSFSADGKLLALLGMDGDAYLFDARAGQLLATLINTGNGEWLVVTPDGKFDGSPNGWSQILWRFSGETFNVAPVETFFNEFYYPGLLSEILAGKKLRATRDFAALDRRQPSLEIAVDGAGTRTVNERTIRARVKVAEAKADKDHPLGSTVRDVRLFRNGALVKTWRGEIDLNPQGEAVLEATLPIVVGPNRLTAYAFNADNIKSPDASLVVTGGPALKQSGVAYLLSVGINAYSNADYDLKFAVADAQDVARELQAQQNKVAAVGKVEVVQLMDADATKKNILLALRRLAGDTGALPAGAPAGLDKLQPAQPEDEVFLYFAGHGAATDARFYLIPYDLGYAGGRADLDEAGWISMMDHSISDLELEDALEKVDARDVLLVIDACNSGQALEAEERRRGPMNSRGLAQLAYEKGMYVLTAAQGYQAALEVKELGHGLLTFALVEEGLKTAAADQNPKDGKVVAREWMDYAAARVPELQEAQMDAAQKQGRAISFVDGEARGGANRGLQRPRVFYRRESDPEPMVVAKP